MTVVALARPERCAAGLEARMSCSRWIGRLIVMAESTAAGDPSALRRLVLDFFGASIGAGWRAATSDGQGAYLAAMLLFGMAAFSFHYALIPQTTREFHLDRNARMRQESLRGEAFPVLAGLVLPQSWPTLCRANAEARDLRLRLRAAYRAFAQHASARYQAIAPVSDARSACESTARASQLQIHPACEATTKNIGPAWTDAAARSLLFIPSMTASSANATCRTLCTERQPRPSCFCSAYDKLLRDHARVIGASLSLEDTSDQLLGRDSETLGLASAYFVSSEGITRAIPAGENRELNFPAHYMNNGASYFFNAILYRDEFDSCRDKQNPDDTKATPIGAQTILDPLPGYLTYPYLDSNGNGLVETYCAPIDISSEPGRPADLTIGVLCSDIAHPETEVIAGLIKATRALDLSFVRVFDPVRIAGSNADQEPTVKLCGEFGDCDEALTRLDETPLDVHNFATMYYHQQLAPNVRALRTGGVYTKPGIMELFAVSVYRGANYWDVAVGHLRQARRQDHAALVLCGLCLSLAVCILVISYRRKAMRRDAYLVRGLTFGVVQVNGSDEIVGANDRAEAILGTPLPTLGTEHGHGRYTGSRSFQRTTSFSSYIDKPRCVLIPLNNTPDEECIVPYNYVRWRSIEGLTTNFYAWLMEHGWIRATARVVVLPDGTENLFYVLSTHICAEHASILERAKQLHTRRESAPPGGKGDMS